MEELNLKCYAHLGDAVYELYIREKVVFLTTRMSRMHEINTSLVCASYQCELLDILNEYLTENELELVRRGRNLPSSRRNNAAAHRLSTGFEVLIGYLYLHNKDRLSELFKVIDKYIETKFI